MSLKSSQSELNLSNGFKKRLLRPVSTQKPNDPRNSMRSSAVLSLHDHISIKNKYGEAKNILQTHCNLLAQNMNELNYKKKEPTSSFESTLSSFKNLQASQHIEKIIKKITEKKQQKQQKEQYLKKSQKSSTISLSTEPKPMQTILKEIGAQNLQQGLKILYMQNQEAGQYLDECIFLLCLCTENVLIRTKQKDNGLKINESDQKPVLIAKLLSFIVSNLTNKININQTNLTTMPQNKTNDENQPKFFKPIVNVEEKQAQIISTLKLQLQRQKQINKSLQERLKTLLANSQTSTKSQTVSVGEIQKIEKQIRKVYDQSSMRKDQMIIKLKTQISQYQQKLSKQSSVNFADQFNKSKNEIINSMGDKQIGYSSTIQEEFQKMRTGFVKKIQKVQIQSNEKQQKLKKQIFNFEKEIQNCQRQKNVLFKKYQFLLNNSE